MAVVYVAPSDNNPLRVSNAINKNADEITAVDTASLKKSSNLSDVSSAATAFANIKQAATDAATGVVELATDAETVTGTDTARATTPAGVAAAIAAAATTTAIARLSANTASGASLDIPLTSYTAYKGFIIYLYGFIPANDGDALWLRFSTDGGSSYDATGYNYAIGGRDDSGSAVAVESGSANQIVIHAAVGSGSTEGVDAEILILGQTSTARWTKAGIRSYGIDNSGTPRMRTYNGAGSRETAQDTDAIRFLFSTGNITSGSYAVFGIP